MRLGQPGIDFIANLNRRYTVADGCDNSREIIAELVRKSRRFVNILAYIYWLSVMAPYSSFRTAFMAPAAFFTSIGLMLTACTRMTTSVAFVTAGSSTWESSYDDGSEYLGVVTACILIAASRVSL